MLSMRACVLLFALPVLVLISPAHAAHTTLADPVAYCQAVANADAPDARYAGPRVPDWMIAALYSKDELKAQKKESSIRRVPWRGAAWAERSLPASRATPRSAARPTRK
jgi:hypothetical protein